MQPLEDCLTFCPIRPEYHVRTQSGDFDVESLYRYYTDNKLDIPRDPFNRQPLSQEDSKRVLNYSKRQDIEVIVSYLGQDIMRSLSVSFRVKRHTNLGSIICRMITEIEYPRARNLARMSDKIEYNFILHIPGQYTDSVYNMDFESPLVLPDSVESVEISMLRAHGARLNPIVRKLYLYASTRSYDEDANYMAIEHYGRNYKPRPETYVPNPAPPRTATRVAIYNQALDKYFDQDGREIPELND